VRERKQLGHRIRERRHVRQSASPPDVDHARAPSLKPKG
jgi:hypothetical protein